MAFVSHSPAIFSLHPQLAADCAPVCDLSVCRVLLMNNCLFPWLILVPMRDNVRELFELAHADYTTVMEEIRMVGQRFSNHTGAYKMNIAALGNMVPQLHIHVIARFENDDAWPAPIWNSKAAAVQPYTADTLASIVDALKNLLK